MYLEIKSADEIRSVEKAAKIASDVLKKTRAQVMPGISTKKIDEIAANEMKALGADPAFLGYRGYPANICVSLNDELVHGIPSESRIVMPGDLVKLDIGIKYKGFYGDIAETIPMGKISENTKHMLAVTYGCFDEMMKYAVIGNRMGDMASAVQKYVEKNGFSVIRQFVGHGIGRQLHEKPEVPNFGEINSGPKFEEGMVLALEPMVASGDWRLNIKDDGWTAVTLDGKLCAHFEKMIIITSKGSKCLTIFEPLFMSRN